MFFLNLYVLEKFVGFFKCDNVKLKIIENGEKNESEDEIYH